MFDEAAEDSALNLAIKVKELHNDFMIKAIIFDWFGVCTVENWRDAVARELHRRLGIDETLIKTEFKKLTPAFAADTISPAEFLNRLIKSLKIEQPSPNFTHAPVPLEQDGAGFRAPKAKKAIASSASSGERFTFIFQTIPALNMAVLNLARQLRRHYKVYLLSNNFGPVFPLYQKQLNLSEYFDELFLSHEMKMNKTQDNIWELLLKRIKYQPGEILFIDNTEKYIALAKTLGVTGVLYKDYTLLLKELNELGIEKNLIT